MANELKELFGNIATAIREKTGEEGTMKPSKFPEKISALPESVETTVNLDFSSGDMEVTPAEGKVFEKVSIPTPANLIPENIAEGVDITGIIGTLVAGGGGKVASGKFKGTGAAYTLKHGLGVVPDVVVVFAIICKDGYLRHAVGFSSKLLTLTGFPAGQYYFIQGGSANSGNNKAYLECTFQTQAFHDANEQTVIVGGSKNTVGYTDPGFSYYWLAIGGLT